MVGRKLSRRFPVALTVAAAALTSIVTVNVNAEETVPQVVLSQVSQHVASGETLIAGEAWVVADPDDPDQLVVNWLATAASNEAQSYDKPFPLGYCGIGRSQDGGETWSIELAPYHSDIAPRTVPICGDPAAGVLSDGSMVLTSIQLGGYEWAQSITSTDNGESWSAPVEVFGARQTLRASAAELGITDLGAGRQWLAVDPTQDVVYVQSQVDVPSTGRMMSVSDDAGATWSVPQPVGTEPGNETGTSLGPIGAAFGTVAGVSDDGTNKVFQTSDDRGATWTYNAVPAWAGAGRAIVAADPTTPDRFAVLVPRGSDRLEVWVTTDAGQTADGWTRTEEFTVAGHGDGTSFFKPWIAFSPNGTLGIVWRYGLAGGAYHVDAVISRDGGTTFDQPVRLTGDRGPAPAVNGMADDCACNIHMSDTTLSTTWGDATNGRRELWFGRLQFATD